MAVQLPARALSIGALLLLCVAPAAAQATAAPLPETGHQWLDRCGALDAAGSDPHTLPAPPPDACLSWVEGLVDLNEIYRGLGALERTGEGFCTPPTATAADAGRAVARYFREHPDTLHFSARILAYMALRRAFPCERRTP